MQLIKCARHSVVARVQNLMHAHVSIGKCYGRPLNPPSSLEKYSISSIADIKKKADRHDKHKINQAGDEIVRKTLDLATKMYNT